MLKARHLSLIALLAALLAMCACGGSPPSGRTDGGHSGVYLRGDFNDRRRSSRWEFTDLGGGRYALYDRTVWLEFIVDVGRVKRWHLTWWGGNSGDTLLRPGAPYAMGRRMFHLVQCGYPKLHCDSIILVTDGHTATITLHTGGEPEPFARLDGDSGRTPLPHSIAAAGTMQVLALGNSLMQFNHQDSTFNALARHAGVAARWTGHTRPGATLDDLWDEGLLITSRGLPSARALVAAKPWTRIVLQDYSLRPLYEPEAFARSVHRWVEYIRRYCPGADVALVVNWPWAMLWDDYQTVAGLLLANSRAVAHSEGIGLCPTGTAYALRHAAGGATAAAALYADERHPSPAGTYLAALLQLSLLTGRPSESFTWSPPTIPPAQADTLRRLATRALTHR